MRDRAVLSRDVTRAFLADAGNRYATDSVDRSASADLTRRIPAVARTPAHADFPVAITGSFPRLGLARRGEKPGEPCQSEPGSHLVKAKLSHREGEAPTAFGNMNALQSIISADGAMLIANVRLDRA